VGRECHSVADRDRHQIEQFLAGIAGVPRSHVKQPAPSDRLEECMRSQGEKSDSRETVPAPSAPQGQFTDPPTPMPMPRNGACDVAAADSPGPQNAHKHPA
jgi:hypothetical protein